MTESEIENRCLRPVKVGANPKTRHRTGSIQDPILDTVHAWPAKSSPVLAISRIFALLSWMVILLACSPIKAILQKGFARPIVKRWHSGSCRIAGVSPTVHGAPVHDRPILFVANHVSYLDISVLGSLLNACFVAKQEVNSWPIFGYLARLQRTVFVERRAVRAADQREALRKRLAVGDSLILFPEGTSSDGNRALRFKSALFDAANIELDHGQIEVQPISIAYTRFDGMPMGRMLRPFYAWYGDMELAPHLWRALGMGTIGVDVIFHEPVKLEQFGSRKALAQHCEAVVSGGLSAALNGRIDRQARTRRLQCDGFDLPINSLAA